MGTVDHGQWISIAVVIHFLDLFAQLPASGQRKDRAGGSLSRLRVKLAPAICLSYQPSDRFGVTPEMLSLSH